MAKKITSRRVTRRRVLKNKRLVKNGGCGCNNVIKGGNINPPSFTGNLPLRYFYGQNDYMNDPSVASESARNLPAIIKGGKRRTKKNTSGKKNRRIKKMKGGDMLLGSAYSNNPLVSFGTTDGAYNSVNLLYGNQSTNPSVYDQPALNGHNINNPALA